jgi:hypothetical protein
MGETLIAIRWCAGAQNRAEKPDAGTLESATADAGHLRLETANAVAGAAVATDFLVDIADHTDLKLLGQELRRAFSLRQLLTFDHAAMLFASD